MNQELSMSPNLLVAALQKPASEFTKADIVSYIKENDIVSCGRRETEDTELCHQ